MFDFCKVMVSRYIIFLCSLFLLPVQAEDGKLSDRDLLGLFAQRESGMPADVDHVC